ncbi:hypothetical protein EDC01DRAFT_30766 [Geopyxis carbonaria]|nr:hypothetical protein EDC01DRAFT_30766 [Geopyxis carbonaria]
MVGVGICCYVCGPFIDARARVGRGMDISQCWTEQHVGTMFHTSCLYIHPSSPALSSPAPCLAIASTSISPPSQHTHVSRSRAILLDSPRSTLQPAHHSALRSRRPKTTIIPRAPPSRPVSRSRSATTIATIPAAMYTPAILALVLLVVSGVSAVPQSTISYPRDIVTDPAPPPTATQVPGFALGAATSTVNVTHEFATATSTATATATATTATSGAVGRWEGTWGAAGVVGIAVVVLGVAV